MLTLELGEQHGDQKHGSQLLYCVFLCLPSLNCGQYKHRQQEAEVRNQPLSGPGCAVSIPVFRCWRTLTEKLC